MGQFRIRHGMAYGKENNFYTGIPGQTGYLAGTAGLFAQSNTSPNVTNGVLFYTNNTSNTTISNFNLEHPAQGFGNLAGLFEGKRIMVWFLDGSTRLAYSTSGPIIGIGTDGLQGRNSYVELMYHTSSWYVVDFARISNDFLIVDSSNFAFATSGINVRGIKTVILNGSGGLTIDPLLLTGGEQNQEVMLYATSGSRLAVNTGGLANSMITTSSSGSIFVVGSNATVSFRFLSPYWVESR